MHLIANDGTDNQVGFTDLLAHSTAENIGTSGTMSVGGVTTDALLINSGTSNAITVSGLLVSSTVSNISKTDVLYFTGTSNAASSLVANGAGAKIDISQQTTSASIGKLTGRGHVYLGSKNLSVGALGGNDVFGGVITNGGIAGGAGGSLTKVGAGTLSLTAGSLYTGDTVVAEGRLYVDGSIVSPDTIVDAGALLGGFGRIGGNVINHGTLYGGDAPGTLTIGGNYVGTPGSGLLVGIESPGVYSNFVIGGSADIAGSLTVNPYGSPSTTLHKYEIVQAVGGVNGTFGAVNVSGLFSPYHVLYYGNSIDILLGSANLATLGGLSGNQRSLARALDAAYNGGGAASRNADYLNVIAALVSMDSAELKQTLDQISPISLAGMTEMAFGADSAMFGNLDGRFNDIRDGADGFSSGVSGGVPIEAVGADGKDDKQPLPPAPKLNHWNVWVSGLGGYADIGATANQPGYSFSDAGTMLGADYRAIGSLRLRRGRHLYPRDQLHAGTVAAPISMAANSASTRPGGRMALTRKVMPAAATTITIHSGISRSPASSRHRTRPRPALAEQIAMPMEMPTLARRTSASRPATIGKSAISSLGRRSRAATITSGSTTLASPGPNLSTWMSIIRARTPCKALWERVQVTSGRSHPPAPSCPLSASSGCTSTWTEPAPSMQVCSARTSACRPRPSVRTAC